MQHLTKRWYLGIWTVALAVVAAAGVPAGSSAGSETFGEMIQRLALEQSGGDLSTLGSMTTWTPAGPTVRPITGHEFVALAQQVAGQLPSSPPPAAGGDATDATAGAAFGNAFTAALSFWPFCDYATGFIFYLGVTPGAAFSTITPIGPDPTPQPPLCGGAFGAASLWADVTLNKANAGVGGILLYCGAAVTWLSGTVDIPVGFLHGGYICDGFGGNGFQSAAGHGRGVPVNLNFGTIQLDVFFGGGNALTVGNPV